MTRQELRSSGSLALIFALRMLGLFLVLPVFALEAQHYAGGNDPAMVGLALGMYGLTQAVFQLPLGLASDRFGRKKVIIVGLLVFALGSLVAALADSLKLTYPQMPCYPAGEGQAKLAAGWLIDQCGLKGFAIGRAAVHQEQALVLVNLGDASAMELIALAAHVRDSVEQKFGVVLEHEVRFMGAQGETWLDEVLS